MRALLALGRMLLVSLTVALSTRAAEAPLTLRQLIDRARANDHRVKEAQAQLRWFRAKYEEAKWAWFPRIDSYLAVAGPMPEARNDGLGGPPLTHATLMYDLDFGNPGVMFRAGAEGVLPIYTFGKLDALEAAGAKGVEAGEALADRARDEAEAQVAEAYWGYCLAESAKSVLAETIGRLDDAQKTLERLRASESEQVTQMDVYKLEFYRKQAEVQLASAEAGGGFALAAIRLLIGASDTEAIALEVVPLERPDGVLPPVERYVAEAKLHRPELRAIEAGLVARQKEVFIRERMFFPDFGIAGFFRWAWTTSTTRQLSPFAYDPYNDLSAGLALVMRYQWDFPQKVIVLEQSRAELEKMEHQKDLLEAAVRLEVTKSWTDVNSALMRATKQTQAQKSAQRWATAAFTAFDVGTGDTRELVDSFAALAVASAARYQGAHDAHVALHQLSKAVGEPVALEPPPPLLMKQPPSDALLPAAPGGGPAPIAPK